MVAWTIARAKELNLAKIEVSCLDIDSAKKDFLINNGFKITNIDHGYELEIS
ncbi:MAG: hypothetical protein PF505_10135 [Vallitaleaceae bacterium]|jgi:hypothetical protein|nr:hypothetical protein [Vallitaleaceae bacterium]